MVYCLLWPRSQNFGLSLVTMASTLIFWPLCRGQNFGLIWTLGQNCGLQLKANIFFGLCLVTLASSSSSTFWLRP